MSDHEFEFEDDGSDEEEVDVKWGAEDHSETHWKEPLATPKAAPLPDIDFSDDDEEDDDARFNAVSSSFDFLTAPAPAPAPVLEPVSEPVAETSPQANDFSEVELSAPLQDQETDHYHAEASEPVEEFKEELMESVGHQETTTSLIDDDTTHSVEMTDQVQSTEMADQVQSTEMADQVQSMEMADQVQSTEMADQVRAEESISGEKVLDEDGFRVMHVEEMKAETEGDNDHDHNNLNISQLEGYDDSTEGIRGPESVGDQLLLLEQQQQQQQQLLQLPQLQDMEEGVGYDRRMSDPKMRRKELKQQMYGEQQQQLQKQKTERAMEQMIVEEDENLDEDFLTTKWVPPTVERAKHFKSTTVFRGGDAPLLSADVTQAADLGSGVCLYFLFNWTMSCYFFLATLLALPALIVCFHGSRIEKQDQDTFGLYRFSLGNMGYNPYSDTYAYDIQCNATLYSGNNGTCLHFNAPALAPLGVLNENGVLELSTRDIGYTFTALELAQVLLFLFFVNKLKKRAKTIEEKLDGVMVKVSDYTLMITNLPPDCTTAELVHHFSSLYPLDRIDFRKRPIITDARPIPPGFTTDCSAVPPGVIAASGGWVADCVIHRKIGSILSSFKEQEDLVQKLYSARARAKMYAEGTALKGGPNLKKFNKAMTELEKCKLKMKSLENQVNACKKIKNPNQYNNNSNPWGQSGGGGGGGVVGGFPSIPVDKSLVEDPLEGISAPPVAAFVTFEYCESYARCLEDYLRYSQWLYWCWYPRQMLFKGRKLKIRPAPEPDSVVWENMEKSGVVKGQARATTAVITFIALLVCFVIILQTTAFQSQFEKEIPDLTLCATTIPSLYLNATSIVPVASVSMARPSKAMVKELDDICDSIEPGSFYAVYTKDGNFRNQVTKYSEAACTARSNVSDLSYSPLCPLKSARVHCPCISTKSSETCKSASCEVNPAHPNLDPAPCVSFSSDTLGSCFCLSSLIQSIVELGPVNGIRTLLNDNALKPCHSFYKQYSLASSLKYLSVFVVVLVNKILLLVLSKLVKAEMHTSTDKYEGSELNKLFSSTYFNMAILVLVASGKAKGQPDEMQSLHLMAGPYSDFDAKWYGNIGTYFITTFITQAATPIVWKLLDYFVIYPLYRAYYYPSIRAVKCESMPKQSDVNLLETGPVFEITDNQIQILALIFLAMTYGAGLPIAMPLACVTCFLFYSVDKLLLCRHCQRPPHMGVGVMDDVLSLMKYAAYFRLAIGCWMFGVLPIRWPSAYDWSSASSRFNQGSTAVSFKDLHYSALLDMAKMSAADNADTVRFLIERIFIPNVLPLFLLFCLLLLYRLLKLLAAFIYNAVPIFWILNYIIKSCRGDEMKKITSKVFDLNQFQGKSQGINSYILFLSKHPLRKSSSPFTGDYFRYVTEDRGAARAQRLRGCFSGGGGAAATAARAAAVAPDYGPIDQSSLTEHERSDGWIIGKIATGKVKLQRNINSDGLHQNSVYHKHLKEIEQQQQQQLQQEEEEGRNGQHQHQQGLRQTVYDLRRTFEVIEGHSCSSYLLCKIPAYKVTVDGIDAVLTSAD